MQRAIAVLTMLGLELCGCTPTVVTRDGGIPYTDQASGAVGLCYPMEGCFSAVPAW